MKLWHIRATVELVLASDDKPSGAAIESAVQEAIRDGGASVDTDPPTPIRSAKDLPNGWDERCLPYGRIADREIGTWLQGTATDAGILSHDRSASEDP